MGSNGVLLLTFEQKQEEQECVQHDLRIAKLHAYGFIKKALN